MRHHFKTEQWLPFPVDLCFAFFSNPENLPRLMPQWQKARIEEAAFRPPPPAPAGLRRYPGVVAGPGTTMTLSFKPFPFAPMRVPWDAEITEFAWNEHFCDVQHRGPFRFWRHCHRLSAENDGTRLRDEVEYELPLGLLGEIAARAVMPAQFKSIFKFRHERTAKLMPLFASAIAARPR